MTLRDKRKNDIECKNTLRHFLESENGNKQIIVIYKGDIVGVGFPYALLNKSSRVFMGLMNRPIKEKICGVSTYIKI